MSKAEHVPWKRQALKSVHVPPPPPRHAPFSKPSTSLSTKTADYRIGGVRVICWNKIPLDKLVNLAYDDIVKDELNLALKEKEIKS